MARQSRNATTHRDPFDPLDGAVDDEIDLHGLTAAAARERVKSGLERVRQQKPGGLVLLITGKGNNSSGQPVLKRAVRAMLANEALPQVAKWGLDHGEGGYLVRLKGGRF
jgi:DNA-nicking Smr family endonuclease